MAGRRTWRGRVFDDLRFLAGPVCGCRPCPAGECRSRKPVKDRPVLDVHVARPGVPAGVGQGMAGGQVRHFGADGFGGDGVSAQDPEGAGQVASSRLLGRGPAAVVPPAFHPGYGYRWGAGEVPARLLTHVQGLVVPGSDGIAFLSKPNSQHISEGEQQ